MGVISIMPTLGVIRRNGDRIGSVILYIITTKGLSGLRLNQERTARIIKAVKNIKYSRLIKLRNVDIILLLAYGFCLLVTGDDCPGHKGSQATFLQPE